MKRSVRLLYFEGCPNVEEARKNLAEALRRAGGKPEWEEVDVQSPSCPARWRGFASPTVLVDGRDVATGARERPGTPACRFGGPPKVEQIAAALSRRSWLASLATVPAAVIAILPASFCPACYPALAGLVGALGLGAYAERLLAPVTAALLLLALGGLAAQWRRSGDYWPLAAGAVGAAAMYAGQFALASVPVKWAGVALLVGASFWNVLPKLKGASGKSCPACAEGR